MIYKKLQETGLAFMQAYEQKYGLNKVGPPKEDEILEMFNKLTEREKYIFVTMPVIVCDFEFDVPDILFTDFEQVANESEIKH